MAGAVLDELARAARDGDVAAFEAIVVATTPEIYGLARRLVGNEHDARDVVQDTYLRAFRSIARFRGDASVQTWLHRICANRASTAIARARRLRVDTLVAGDNDPSELRTECLPEAAIGWRAEREVLQRAIDRLPAGLRAVVVLHDIYDLPHAAIATELRISLAASKVRLHRARRQLRDELLVTARARRSRASVRATTRSSLVASDAARSADVAG